MKLQARLKKTLAFTAVATTLFSCVPVFAADYTGHWAEATINEWKSKGIIDGYEDGSFKPKEQVTRAEFAKMITKVFGLTYTEGAKKYNDVAADAWYAPSVQAVSAAGLMTGENGNFRPSDIATREEAAFAIAEAYHVAGKSNSTYKDQEKIASWAVGAIDALTANGYMNGYPEDGTFRPQGSLTRAEAVTMLDKITADIVVKAGTYTQDTQGNLVVNTKDVVLKDMIVNGNLYLAEGIGEGDVTLEGVTVTGNIIVEGGGINSVKVKGKSKVKNVIITKAGKNPVRLAVDGTATVTGSVEVTSGAIIEGTAAKIPMVIINGAQALEIKGTVAVEKVEVASKVTLTLAKGVAVQEVAVGKVAEGTKLEGNGTVEKLHSEAGKVTIGNAISIDKDKITAGEGVTLPSIDKPSGGGGGGGGGGGNNGGSQEDKAIALQTSYVATKTGEQEERKIIEFNNGNNLVIEYNTSRGTVTVNDEIFRDGQSVTGIIFDTKADKDITFSIASMPFTAVSMKENKQYGIGDIAELVQIDNIFGEEGEVAKLITILFNGAKDLSEEQKTEYITAALRHLSTIETIIRGNLAEDSIPVSSIISYIEEVKLKAADPDVINAYEKVNEILKAMYGIEVTGIGTNNDIEIRFRVDMKAPGHKDTLNVTLKF